MATLVSFWSIFGDKMANLGLIDFKIGMSKLMKILGKTNLQSICNNLAKMAIFGHETLTGLS